jgi:hypothetical protein
VSLVNSFCRGLRLALAARRHLSWPGCGLRHLPCLAELVSGRVLGHYAESRKFIGDWDGWPSHQLILVCIEGPLPGCLRVVNNSGHGGWVCLPRWAPSSPWRVSGRGHDIVGDALRS